MEIFHNQANVIFFKQVQSINRRSKSMKSRMSVLLTGVSLMIIWLLFIESSLAKIPIPTQNPSQGITIVCEENYMQINIDVTKYPNLDPAEFHLKEKDCGSTVSGKVIKLRTALNECGTTVVESTNKTTYKNIVRAYEIKNANVSVTREEDLTLPFNCSYNRRDTVSTTSFQPLRRIDATESSLGNFTFTMDLFDAKDYATAYTQKDYPIDVQLNDPIYVQFKVMSKKGGLHIFAEKCLATTTTSEKTLPSYVFLDEGCTIDATMDYKYKPNRVQNFTIDAFRFIKDNPIVYFHCLLMVCHSKTKKKTKCATGCVKQNRRRKREVSRGHTIIDESKLYHLASGPLTRKRAKVIGNPDPPSDSNHTPTAIIIASVAVLGIILLIASIVLTICLLYKRKVSDVKDLEPLQLRQYDGDAVFRLYTAIPRVTVHI